MENTVIRVAGREIPEAVDRIWRYCGFLWSGHHETFSRQFLRPCQESH